MGAVVQLKIERTPYTYILEWTAQNKRYIGARWGAGCHPDDLWTEYFTSSRYVHEFVQKHGKPDIILIDKTFVDPMEAQEREIFLLRQYDAAKNPNFLNKSMGGHYDRSDPEIRARISAGHRGKKIPAEWVEWVTEFHRTRPRSPETNKKIGDALRGKERLERRGKKMSPEARAKMSAAKMGKPLSPEHAAKSRVTMLGKKHSEETKRLMSQQRTGKQYPIVTCPHCGKSGGKSAMHAWHFDNCRLRGG